MSAVRRALCRIRGHDTVSYIPFHYCVRCRTTWPRGRTTDPGGVDGPPYDRPGPWSAVDPEAGARALDDDYLGEAPGRYLPP